LSFSAAAWSVATRDAHIGWSPVARTRNLSRVVCNSRFLIVPTVQVKNLASHALGLVLERLADDWRTRYGFEPVLAETFVEKERFAGTCYRASNWLRVGQTLGRGRQDRNHAATAPIKDVYLYPLCREWREVLCVEPPKQKSLPTRRLGADWAEEEFGKVSLGDKRLRQAAVHTRPRFLRAAASEYPRGLRESSQDKGSISFHATPEG
jgi:hypothetical protein